MAVLVESIVTSYLNADMCKSELSQSERSVEASRLATRKLAAKPDFLIVSHLCVGSCADKL